MEEFRQENNTEIELPKFFSASRLIEVVRSRKAAISQSREDLVFSIRNHAQENGASE